MTAKIFNSPTLLSQRLSLPLPFVHELLNDLALWGLVHFDGKEWGGAVHHVHLNKNALAISRHHSNWRIKALQSLDQKCETDFHYSGVFTIAKSDAFKLQQHLVAMIDEMTQIIKPSPSEEVFAVCLDYFNL